MAAQPSDLDVKAAFLTKFPAYLTWPPEGRPAEGAPFSICIVGSDPFGPRIDNAARGQQVNGHGIRIRRLGSPNAAAGCQVAFVRASSTAGTAALLNGLAGKPVLTVTDARSGPSQGMVHFEVVGGRVRFRIDEAAAQSSGLEVSSRLLDLALSVKRAR
jgi:hypothetical protein